MGVEALSADKLAEMMRAQGASEEEIAATTGIYAEAKYAPKMVQLKPEFWMESDQVVYFGKEKHVLRKFNGNDLNSILLFIPEIIRMLAEERGDDRPIEQILKESTPDSLFSEVLHRVAAFKSLNNEYPDWYVAILEHVCKLINYGDGKYTPSHIIAMTANQKIELFVKIWQVNQQDFLGLWGNAPQFIRSWISSQVSPLISSINQMNEIMSKQTNSSGGAGSTGKSSS